MADTAFQTHYRDSFIAGFEEMNEPLRAACTTEAVFKGNQATFLVADSGSASAVNRGINGLIPARADNNTQLTATLTEKHDLVRKTGFNIFASQGNQQRLMQETNMYVVRRSISDEIIAQLDTATNDTGTAQVATLDLVAYAKTVLGNNYVPTEEEDNMFALISPAFDGYLMQVPEYASADYVETKPFAGPARKFRRWFGVNWICYSRLTGSVGAGGAGTSEQCFMFHRNGIGHAANTRELSTAVGYDDEQDYSYSRASIYSGAKLLQNSGVVMMKHNGAGYVAQ